LNFYFFDNFSRFSGINIKIICGVKQKCKDYELMTRFLLKVKKMSLCDEIIELDAKIEASPVCDTSCLAEQIYSLLNRKFLREKCPKSVNIQFLRIGLM